MLAWEANGQPLLPGARLPAAADRPDLVRHGQRQVAQEDHGDRPPVPGRRAEAGLPAADVVERRRPARAGEVGQLARSSRRDTRTRSRGCGSCRPARVPLVGKAWSGFAPIVKVEVSTDDRRTWSPATLGPPVSPYSWTPFEFTWNATPGETILSSRATDADGQRPAAEAVLERAGHGAERRRAHRRPSHLSVPSRGFPWRCVTSSLAPPISSRLAFRPLGALAGGALALALALGSVGGAPEDLLPAASLPAAPDQAGAPVAIPNRGQADAAVRYEARGSGATLFFTDRDVVLARRGGAALRLRFAGASATPVVTGAGRRPGVVNDLRGHDPARWRAGLPTFGAVAYRGLYPGVDVRQDVSAGAEGPWVRSTYTVAAGADPARIRWRYAGGARVDASGALRAGAAGTLVAGRPAAWQMTAGGRAPVDAAYRVHEDGTVGLRPRALRPRTAADHRPGGARGCRRPRRADAGLQHVPRRQAVGRDVRRGRLQVQRRRLRHRLLLLAGVSGAERGAAVPRRRL